MKFGTAGSSLLLCLFAFSLASAAAQDPPTQIVDRPILVKAPDNPDRYPTTQNTLATPGHPARSNSSSSGKAATSAAFSNGSRQVVQIIRFEVDGKEVSAPFQIHLYANHKWITPERVNNGFVVPIGLANSEDVKVHFQSGIYDFLINPIYRGKFSSDWIVGVDSRPYGTAKSGPEKTRNLMFSHYIRFVHAPVEPTKLVVAAQEQEDIPEWFAYPATETIMVAKEIESNSLSGILTDPDDYPIQFALVEILDEDGQRVAAVVTDDEGRFSLESRPGVYRLKFSYVGYDNLRLKVRVTPREKRNLEPQLQYQP